MANPRRNSISTNYQTPISNPDTNSQFQTLNSLKLFLKKPHSFPFLLSIFLFLTWVFLRLQRPPPPPSPHLSAPSYTAAARKWSGGNDDDRSANLGRYSGLRFPSPIAKDNHGWMIDPISFAYKAGLSGESSSSNQEMKRLPSGKVKKKKEQHEDLAIVPAVHSLVQSLRGSFTEDCHGICKFRSWSDS